MHNSQEVANSIKNLAKSKRIAVGKMLSDCSLSINTLSSMQSGGYYPRLEAIAKIADYLDCSVDYLLGRTDIPEVNTSISHKDVEKHKILADIKAVNDYINDLTENPNYISSKNNRSTPYMAANNGDIDSKGKKLSLKTIVNLEKQK